MNDKPTAEQIDDILTLYGGWKADILSCIRSAILAVSPEITEAVKWRMPSRPEGLPVWMHDGNICLAETFNNDIKLVFVKGKFLPDPTNQFNARLQSKTDRAITFTANSIVNEPAIQELVRQAMALNSGTKITKKP